MSPASDRVHLLKSAGRGLNECTWAVAELTRRLEAEATRRDLVTRRVRTVPAAPSPPPGGTSTANS